MSKITIVDDQRILIHPANESDWLAMRHQDVTSTEIAALYGCHSYGLTEFSLYHQKKGDLVQDWSDNDRMKWGRRMEATIAVGIAEDLGLIVKPFKDYGRMPSIRAGSSFDFRVIGITKNYDGEDETYRDLFRKYGDGLVEVKNVDGMIFRRGWLEEDGNIEAPLQIELQMQHQMEVSGLEWCLGAPLIGGNTPKPFFRLRDRDIGDSITSKIEDFWARIDANDEPEPDFEKDGDAISQLYLQDNGETIDLDEEESAEIETLCSEYANGAQMEKDGKAKKSASKASIIWKIKDYTNADLENFKISATTVQENSGVTVTEDMIGQRFGDRKSYQLVLVYVKNNDGKLITPEMVGTQIQTKSAYRGMRVTKKKVK